MTTPEFEDVAAAAGVHRSTVSRAVSLPEAMKRETRGHVLQAPASTGYTMSPLAQALRTKCSTLVPLIVADITNPFFAELAKPMRAAAGERGYQLVLCVTENDATATAGYLHAMRSLYAPFEVIAPLTQPDPAEFEPFGFGSCLVVIDRMAPDYPAPTVAVDNVEGIQLAFDHLVALGHRSIAYVAGIVGTNAAADRREAYHALARANDVAPLEFNEGIGAEAGERAAEHLASMDERPSAVIAANDVVAFGLISASGNPPLTSVRQAITEMGRIAIELAEQGADSGRAEHVVLRSRLLIRSSTGVVAR